MVILGICLLEEVKMKKRAGEDYEEYRNRTPFLFPIPGFLKWIIKIPLRLIIRKKRPEKKKEVGLAIALYTFIFIGLSLFWVDLTPNEEVTVIESKPYSQQRVDSLIFEITKPQSRRYREVKPFGELLAMGEKTIPVLIDLMENTNSEVREFAVMAAARYKVTEAIPALIRALGDPEFRIIQSAVRGLGEMNAIAATDTLLFLLENPVEGVSQNLLLNTLSKMGCTRIMPYLVERLEDSLWYHTTGALRSMIQLDFNATKPYIYKALEDERHLVRREAVYMLLETLPEDAVPYLEKVSQDKNWDVRFYARQAIRKINEKSDEH